MSAERRPERRRLPKSVRAQIRRNKAETRKRSGVTQPSVDSSDWEMAVEFMKVRLADWEKHFAPHLLMLKEYFKIRQEIGIVGFKPEMFREFQAEHDPELFEKLKPAFAVITQFVGKPK